MPFLKANKEKILGVLIFAAGSILKFHFPEGSFSSFLAGAFMGGGVLLLIMPRDVSKKHFNLIRLRREKPFKTDH